MQCVKTGPVRIDRANRDRIGTARKESVGKRTAGRLVVRNHVEEGRMRIRRRMKHTPAALHRQNSDERAAATNDEYVEGALPEGGPPSAYPAWTDEWRGVGPLSEVVPLVRNALEARNDLGCELRRVNRDCRPRPRPGSQTVAQCVLEETPPAREASGAPSTREPCSRRRPSSRRT
jgi:hypothetical protein